MQMLEKIAGMFDEMDVLARAQFMEGFLGYRPFSAIRGANGKFALLKRISLMASEIGAVNPAWLSKSDTGLYRSVLMAVSRAIRSAPGERAMEGADLLQTMMGLAGWEDEETGETLEVGGKSPFWLAGKYASTGAYAKRMQEGDLVPDDASGLSVKLAHRRALDVLRSEALRARKTRENADEIMEETVSDSSDDDGGEWDSIVQVLLSEPNHPLSKKFFGWIQNVLPQVMRGPKASEVMGGYFQLLGSGELKGGRGVDTRAAEILGITPMKLYDFKKTFETNVVSYIEANPSARAFLQGLFEDTTLMRDLFRGRVRLAASLSPKAKALLEALAGHPIFKTEKVVSRKSIGDVLKKHNSNGAPLMELAKGRFISYDTTGDSQVFGGRISITKKGWAEASNQDRVARKVASRFMVLAALRSYRSASVTMTPENRKKIFAAVWKKYKSMGDGRITGGKHLVFDAAGSAVVPRNTTKALEDMTDDQLVSFAREKGILRS